MRSLWSSGPPDSIFRMRDGERTQELPNGSIRGSDEIEYHRTPRRVTRLIARELIAAGASLATSVYPEGLKFYENGAASSVWEGVSPYLVVGKSPRVRDLQWIGHVWESADGRVLLHFEGRH